MLSREFSSPEEELYVLVGNGVKFIDRENVRDVVRQMPSKNEFLKIKAGLSLKILGLLSSCDSSFVFSSRDFDSFNENPLEFSKKVFPNSNSSSILGIAIEVQAELNNVYGNYCVALERIRYLEDLYLKNKQKNDKLLEKYALVCTKMKDFASLKTLDQLDIPNIIENNDFDELGQKVKDNTQEESE